MPPCNKTNVNISFIAKKHQLHFGICSGVGRTIETSALENLDGGQFTFINAVDNTKLSIHVNGLQGPAKFPHSPVLPYVSIYGDLLFSESPVRCGYIMKYRAVWKFFPCLP